MIVDDTYIHQQEEEDDGIFPRPISLVIFRQQAFLTCYFTKNIIKK
jgi:hypothetical protein